MSARINLIDRITFTIEIRIFTEIRIATDEPSDLWIVGAGAHMVETDVSPVLIARRGAVLERAGSTARAADRLAEGRDWLCPLPSGWRGSSPLYTTRLMAQRGCVTVQISRLGPIAIKGVVRSPQERKSRRLSPPSGLHPLGLIPRCGGLRPECPQIQGRSSPR